MRLFIFCFCLFVNQLQALEFSGALTQGGHAFARVEAGSKVMFAGKEVLVGKNGWFGIGFNRNHGPEAEVAVTDAAGVKTVHSLLITPRKFKVQNVNGVPQKTVTPNKTQNTRAADDSRGIKAARSGISGFEHFLTAFKQPVQGRISGVYGSRRTYNGAERSWHKGLDIAAPTGTPIAAPAAGRVVFAADTFYNGNLIILDHGQQFFTIYAHLDTMATAVGDDLKQGQTMGTVGTTGRSTGPHLHWGLYWGQMALDPALLLTDF